jgi:hypothetical protein
MCRNLAKQHANDPDVPAAPGGADGYAKWVQIALILYRVELQKSLRETKDYLNEIPGILAVFDLNDAPHYSSFHQLMSLTVNSQPYRLVWHESIRQQQLAGNALRGTESIYDRTARGQTCRQSCQR